MFITSIRIRKKNIFIVLVLLILICSFFLSYRFSSYANLYLGNQIGKHENSIKVPIIMYHSVLKDTSKSGKYIITPSTLESDLQYIKNAGYETITINDLISYVYNGTSLPEKCIILTFDDGHYNNFTYVLPLLEKYNSKAVISIVGKYTDTYTESDESNTNYSYLRWKDIKFLIQTGKIEFQNHTYNMHNSNSRKGCMKKTCESIEHYESVLKEDIMKLQQEFLFNTGYLPTTFTYPFGGISNASYDIIKNLGFKASLSCNSGINYITNSPDCLYGLKRNNRPNRYFF